jgi:hypothetical protein
VSTVPREGWAGLTNGELLLGANERFDILVTGDRNLEYQQNLAGTGLAVIVLIAPNNRVETIVAMAPQLLEALGTAEPGRATRVTA